MKILIAIFSLVYLLTGLEHARAQSFEWLGEPIDISHKVGVKDSFIMKQMGVIKGYWVWETRKEKGEYRFIDHSVLNKIVDEKFQMVFDSERSTTKKVTLRIDMDNLSMESEISRNTNRDLKGYYQITGAQNRSQKIDTIYNDPIILRPEIFGLLTGMENLKNLDKSLGVFFLSSGQISTMRLKHLNVEEVEVPMGNYSTDVILFEGDNAVSNKIYVTRDQPKKIVKVEVLGQNLSIELVDQF